MRRKKKMNKKIILRIFNQVTFNKIVLIFIFLISPIYLFCNGQVKERNINEDNNNEILKNIYPYIRLISNGPLIDAEIEPGRPSAQGEYSYFFRIVVRVYESWDLIYLERIGVFDEEGIHRRLTKHIFVDLGSRKR